jgi:hypothetical protein
MDSLNVRDLLFVIHSLTVPDLLFVIDSLPVASGTSREVENTDGRSMKEEERKKGIERIEWESQ